MRVVYANHLDGIELGRCPDAPTFDREAADFSFVAATVASVFNVAQNTLRAPTRSCADVAFARQVAMYIMHVEFGWSLTSVGRRFGRDRTTAGYACRRVEDCRDDPAIDTTLTAIERAVAACQMAARSRLEMVV